MTESAHETMRITIGALAALLAFVAMCVMFVACGNNSDTQRTKQIQACVVAGGMLGENADGATICTKNGQ